MNASFFFFFYTNRNTCGKRLKLQACGPNTAIGLHKLAKSYTEMARGMLLLNIFTLSRIHSRLVA